jgi:nickel transport protein
MTASAMKPAALLVATAALLSPLTGSAHEVLHTVERGRALAVKAYFADGEVLAYTQYEVFSPSDAKIPHQKGRTDRNGYLAFVPDAAGPWRVKVVDDSGHGAELTVDAAASAGATGGSTGSSAVSSAAFILRPLAGLAVIGAIFVGLVLLRRRKGRST